MRHGSTLEEAVRVRYMSVGSKESRKDTLSIIRKERPVRDSAAIILAVISTSTLACLSYIDKDGREVLASKCFEKIKIPAEIQASGFFLVM